MRINFVHKNNLTSLQKYFKLPLTRTNPVLTTFKKFNEFLSVIVNSITYNYSSIAFICMVTHQDFIQELKSSNNIEASDYYCVKRSYDLEEITVKHHGKELF